MRIAIAPYILKFHQPAVTSRSVMLEKPTVFIKIFDEGNPDMYGIGEAAVFPGLSPEANEDLPMKYLQLAANIALGVPTDLSRHSSIQFGLEQAILDYSNNGKGIYYPSPFTEGKESITINGLVWMGSYNKMRARIKEKLDKGFSCIKLKIGAIKWDEELELIRSIRKDFSAEEITLRLDANGAFSPSDALEKLKQLSDYHIHSIEQPIKQKQYEAMARLCEETPIPIALDEELIGLAGDEREKMLDAIHPQYIILKPALCGGLSGAEQWIAMSKQRGIGWWVTSALESNVGLTAIAQWTGTLGVTSPQGLGTGALYSNNSPSRLSLKGDQLSFDASMAYDRRFFETLDWRY